MKNLTKIGVAVLAFFAISSVMAQETTETDLTVNIGSSYNIQIGQAAVSIDMNIPSHFVSGNESGAQLDHLQITASGSYIVEVKADGPFFQGPSNDLAVNNIEVEVIDTENDLSGNQGDLSSATVQTVVLSEVDQQVISALSGDLLRGYNVNYKVPAASASNFLNKDEGAYVTTITYTITPN